MHRTFERGFTLIELLVVVAVVGLLASLIFAALGSTRAGAQVAAGKQLDSTIKHTIGDTIEGEWGFDSVAAASTQDSSGFTRNGTIQGTGATVVPGQFDKGISLNPLSDQTSITLPVTLSSSATTITVSFWVKPANSGTGYMLGSKPMPPTGSDDGSWAIFGGNGGVQWYTPMAGPPVLLSCSNVFSANVWHHIVATYKEPTVRLIVDGSECAKGDYPAFNTAPFYIKPPDFTRPVVVGGYGFGIPWYWASGAATYDQVRIYSGSF